MFTKSLFHLAIVMPMLLATVGCDDREVATGVATAAIVAGAAIIATNIHYASCEPGYRNSCHSYFDYRGALRRECRLIYDPCATRRYDALSDFKMADNVDPLEFAQEFQMSYETAEKLIPALQQAKTGDINQFLSLGLTKEDVYALGNFKLPSEFGIDLLAKSLDQSAVATTGMLNRMIAWAITENNSSCFSGAGERRSSGRFSLCR